MTRPPPVSCTWQQLVHLQESYLDTCVRGGGPVGAPASLDPELLYVSLSVCPLHVSLPDYFYLLCIPQLVSSPLMLLSPMYPSVNIFLCAFLPDAVWRYLGI